MPRSAQLLLLVLVVLLAAPSSAPARTSLDVSIGWDGSVRAGRWMPLFVTVSDPATRSVVIDLEMPQGGAYVMKLRQFVTIGPQPTTLILYVPAQERYSDPPVVNLRDADSGKLLARWPHDPDAVSSRSELVVQSDKSFIGVTGPSLRLDQFDYHADLRGRVAGIKPELLPDQPVGYDPLDMLVMHRADLNRIEHGRQQAIVDWVRQGGCLLLWPSPQPTPADSPIGQILPARVGGPKNYVISSAQREKVGLQARFTGIVGHALSPVAGAEPIELLPPDDQGATMTAYAHGYGFGRVIVSPIDLNELAFSKMSLAPELFKKVLAGTGLETRESSGRNYYGLDPAAQLQQSAVSDLQDHLANVPGAGRFGFSYVVWVVLGMMAVVGPVDWFVLKRLGRQPWTWVTTTGWIAAITMGALFIGQIFKSGDLHYRTVTLIDQAGDQTVARTTLAGIYSPRTTEYHLDAAPTQNDANGQPVPTLQPPAGWWEPASAMQYGSGGMNADVPFRQTTEGNLPQAMTINVWNLRAMRGENLVPGEPVLTADLRVVGSSGDRRLTGTITNHSARPLVGVRVFVRDGPLVAASSAPPAVSAPATNRTTRVRVTQEDARLAPLLQSAPLVDRIAPGQTVNIDGRSAAGDARGADSEKSYSRSYNYYDSVPPEPEAIWALATGLSGRRTMRTAELLRDGEHAVIYATLEGAEPTVALRESAGAREQHETVVRALVRLKPED